jgi:hypothetical protein
MTTANAQVILTSSDMPPVDSLYIFSDAGAPSTPFVFETAGDTAVWDFTGLTVNDADDDTIVFADPAAIAPGAFTGATHARIRIPGETAYGILKVDATGVYLVGGAGDVTGTGSDVVIPYETPVTVHSFPFTTTTDIQSAGIVNFLNTGAYFGYGQFVDSVWLHAVTESHSKVIATGTLALPSGTWPAMLEVVYTTTYDSTMVKGTQTSGNWIYLPGKPDITIDSTYNWYTQESLMPYASVEYDNGTPDISFFKAGVVDHTGIGNRSVENGTAVYPNPFQNAITVDAKDGGVRYELYSLDGRQLLEGTVKEGTDRISTALIPPGLYLLKLNNASGTRTLKLIKE